MDTTIGKNGKEAILTFVERITAFCMAQKLLKGKNAKKLSKIVYGMLLPYKEYVHTITVGNGSEFADHQTLTEKLNTQIYFTHPYSSWEKGLIDNTNKLIRQYIPKKSNFNKFNNKKNQTDTVQNQRKTEIQTQFLFSKRNLRFKFEAKRCIHWLKLHMVNNS